MTFATVIAFGALAGSQAAYAQASPAPYTTGIRYDAAGRISGTIAPDPDGSGPLRYAATRTTFDARGLPTIVETGELASWQSEAIEPKNWSGFTVLATVEATYDVYRRKSSERTRGLDGITASLTQYSYDAAGRLECTAVRMNPATYGALPMSACTLGTEGSQGPDRITRSVYDAADQLLQVRKGVGTTLEMADVTYSYTLNGKTEYVIDANGNRAKLEYDGFDRQVKWIFPSQTRPASFSPSTPANALATAGSLNTADYEQYGYDANGIRTSLRKRDGSVISYQYDALNRMTVKQVPERVGLDPAHTQDVHYQYDLRGLQTRARFGSIYGSGPVNVYDGFGRLAETYDDSSGTGYYLRYSHDANGNRTRIQHDDGAFFDYFYDGAGRPVRIQTPSGVGMVAFTYDARGLPYQRASGSWSTFSYDPVGRLSTQAEDMAGSSGDVTWSFTRNPASQILTETQNNDAYSWNGHVDLTRSYATNGLNQYTSAGGYTFAHDANGNLISDGISSYLYDVENRLVRVTGGGHTTDLYYDPLGRLYRTTSTKPGTGTIRYLYDGDALVAEYDGAGTLIRRHVHGPAAGVDDPLATFAGSSTDGSTASLLKSDPRGSIAAAVDWSGNLQSINTYDEYGINGTGNTGRFQYTGQAWLPEIGMYYYKARIYSPTLGRFLQTDPIGYEDQVNLYAYVGNDPINGIDPSGEELVVLEGPDPTDRTAVLNTLAAAARADPVLKQRLIAIMKSENVIAVKPNSGGPTNAPPSNYRDAAKPGTDPDATGKGSGSRVNLNMDAENIQGNIVHEILGHAYDSDQGQLDMSRHPTGIRQYEEDATQIENRYHQATDPTKVRDDYNGRPIKPLDE